MKYGMYPSHLKARVTSLFMSGVSLAGICGGPISGWILKNFEGIPAFRGWQWMYILEAIPSLIIGFILIWYLDDRIPQAQWLSEREKT